ncbi:MAG: flavodoxin family protein [Spartobacteria bacterium]|nr:flavodoxin family protein [Spartobacteria bacterium]
MEQAVQSNNPHPKVLGIGGSPRKGGNSDVILQHVLKGVTDQSCAAEGIHLRDVHYQGCIGCECCRKDKICTGLKDGMSLIYQDILESQGLVLVSPTHQYNITSWMKAFIDRLYCFYDFNNNRPRGWSSRLTGQQRKAIVVGICEQEKVEDMGFTLDAMRLPLEALGYEVITAWPVFRLFDRAKIKENQELLHYAKQLGADLAQSL